MHEASPIPTKGDSQWNGRKPGRVMKYTGANNDRDPILLNVGGSTPTVVRHAELP